MNSLEQLDAFLASDKTSENCMLLSDLDGFMTGILCSPVLIPPSEWLWIALGLREGDVGDLDAFSFVSNLVLERYNAVTSLLNNDPATLEPIFWQTQEGNAIAMDWCEGFMQAVHLRTDRWEPLLVTEKGQELMFPILAHLIDEKGNSLVGAKDEELDMVMAVATERIPEVIPHIFQFWQSRRVETNYAGY